MKGLAAVRPGVLEALTRRVDRSECQRICADTVAARGCGVESGGSDHQETTIIATSNRATTG